MSNSRGNSVHRISIMIMSGFTRYAEYERRLKGSKNFDSRIIFVMPLESVEALRIIQLMADAQMILLKPAYIIDANRGMLSWVLMNTRKNSENTLITQKVPRVN